jgi:predicted 2-oxoglutarate/Fe(II)-dependent dioxygenase YbiX
MDKAKYVIWESVLDKDHIKDILDYAKNNPTYHPFNNFQGFSPEWKFIDKDHAIENLLKKALAHFKDAYEVEGKKVIFDRQHGNIMNAGSKLDPHVDVYDPADPNAGPGNALVFNIFITDDYEGGELIFENLGESFKMKAGDAILFPGFLLNHGVNEVKSGSRINIINHYFLVDA